jgi:leucyl/phenylalanyl-tRNA--protein transferase
MIDINLLIRAYKMGFFPMADHLGRIRWFSPDPRGVLPLDEFHVPHGLKRRLKKGEFEITIDQEFERVMRACGEREETWINDEILETYCALHHAGYAHSVEARLDGELVGGLYGVALGGAFFGESMFHWTTDASKVALHALVTRMKKRGFLLLDIQWTTPHLEKFGAREVPQSEYLRMLRRSQGVRCEFA